MSTLTDTLGTLKHPAAGPPGARPRAFDAGQIRADFPILHSTVHGKPLVYLDNGATTQKPRQVIDAISRYYESQNANIHRGVYHLSQLATELWESSRRRVASFINAPDERECVFTRGTTEAINLVAGCWGRTFLKPGDEVVVSAMEHHSNIVPWQIACEMAGARLRVIPMTTGGELRMEEYEKLLAGGRVRFVSVVHLSNSLGTINDVKRIAQLARQHGALVMSDGAQWVAHYPTDVQDLGVDFYAFSGHKLFGPTGIGVLWGKRELLEKMPPYQGGGDMIESVTFEKTTYAAIPNKFEAGTPDIAGAVGLAAAIDYLNGIDLDAVHAHEEALLAYATQQLRTIPGLRVVGNAKHKGSVISFVMEDPVVSSFDIGMKLDLDGVAVRTGHHCCQPVMDFMKIPGTARASLAMYNTKSDVDALVSGLKRIVADASARSIATKAAPPTPGATSGAPVKYPSAAAASPDEAARELAEDFELFGDAQERVQYVDDLGGKMPPMPESLKTDETFVKGCMSTVHIAARKRPGTDDVIEFLGDSNTPIVKGLIAIVQRVWSGQRAADILAFDMPAFLRRIGLENLVTVQRRIGLEKVIERVREQAKRLAGE
jgi:cysteine desulfurase / selenocysteine lyase